MPLVKITTSENPPAETVKSLLRVLSKLLASELGKPEQWVMTCFDAPAQMTFAGSEAPAAYIEVKNIGKMSAEQARRISAGVTRETSEALGVPANRTYVELTDAVGHLWGWDGDTFA